eukprot:scaffold42157_cov29-Cyclotella_meneghiniana.AAC.1
MKFSILCLHVICLSGAATTASVLHDLQVFLAVSQALLSITSKGSVSSSAPNSPNGVHADGSWQHPLGDALGRYFTFDITEWESYFGSFTSGVNLSIDQCRGHEPIYSGEIRVWNNEYGISGRREPRDSSSEGDWQS